MPRRLAQQRMALSDLECLKSTPSASRAISTVAELLVITPKQPNTKHTTYTHNYTTQYTLKYISM